MKPTTLDAAGFSNRSRRRPGAALSILPYRHELKERVLLSGRWGRHDDWEYHVMEYSVVGWRKPEGKCIPSASLKYLTVPHPIARKFHQNI